MIENKIITFITMHGFGDYIWSAYGITAVVLLWLVFSSLISQRKIKKQLQNYASNS